MDLGIVNSLSNYSYFYASLTLRGRSPVSGSLLGPSPAVGLALRKDLATALGGSTTTTSLLQYTRIVNLVRLWVILFSRNIVFIHT